MAPIVVRPPRAVDPLYAWFFSKLLGLRGSLNVFYVGATETAQLKSDLRGGDIPSHVIDYTFDQHGIGGNRNIGLLLARGGNTLMIDDDVECRIWRSPDGDDALAIAGHSDPRHWEFFETREQAVGIGPVDVDFCGEHAKVLGLPLVDLLADCDPVDWSGACGHVPAALLDESRTPIVRMSFAGLAGDSARYCPHQLLFASGPVHDAMAADEHVFRMALSSREVRRIVRRPTVSHDWACMTYCVGIDLASYVPPFSPVGRNEDGLFGAMLGFADRDAMGRCRSDPSG